MLDGGDGPRIAGVDDARNDRPELRRSIGIPVVASERRMLDHVGHAGGNVIGYCERTVRRVPQDAQDTLTNPVGGIIVRLCMSIVIEDEVE